MEKQQGAFDQCVLLDLSFSRLGVQKKVRRQDVEVSAKGAEVPPEAVRLTKRLIESETFDKIVSGDGALTRAIADLGLPYRRGLYAMPIRLVERAIAMIEAWVVERVTYVDALCAEWPGLIDGAEVALGPVFSRADYPTVDEVRSAFRVRWTIVELSASSKLREISPAMYETERAKVQAEVSNAAEQWRGVLREAFVVLVESLRSKLDGNRDGGKPQIFRDTRVDNLKEWIGLFDARNVTGDEELATLVEKARGLLAGTNADDLRDDASLRKWAANQLGEIKSAAATLVTADAPRRKFRLTDDEAA